MHKWIDGDSFRDKVGDVGFLVLHHNENRGTSKYFINDRPAHTNGSHEPRLSGWCGTTDNVSVHACGVAKITKIAKNGRLHIVTLNGDDEDAALEELGYPELKA